MAPDQAFPLLAALFCLPALGAVTLTLFRGRDELAPWIGSVFAAIPLGLAVWAATAEGVPVERYPWIPSLGVSAILELDRLGAVLAAWAALASVLDFIVLRPGARTTAIVLLLQAAATALFFAGDVALVLACLGVASVAVALLTSVPRNVLVFAAAGLVVLSGWFARYYEMAFVQTGFPSTELARWRALVLFPGEERWLFLTGAFGIALLLPAFAIAVENAPRSHRVALFASAGTLGSFFVVRVLVPLAPRGAESSAGWVVALGVLLMAWAGLARGWTLLAVGYQGLILLGVLADLGDVPSEVMMLTAAAGFSLAMLPPPRTLGAVLGFLVGVPIVAIWVPAWREPSAAVVIGTFAFVLMTLGFVRVVRRAR